MIRTSCHCGAVRLEVAAIPAEVTDCKCSNCRRQSVLLAYYPPSNVRLVPADAATDICMWDDQSIGFYRCRTCGCVSHQVAVDPERNRTGVNARLMDSEVLSRPRVRHLDGAGTEEYID